MNLWRGRVRTPRIVSHDQMIAIEMVVVAEMQHREAAVRMHGWRAERRAEFEEAARKRKLEAERAEREKRERLERLEQARIIGFSRMLLR